MLTPAIFSVGLDPQGSVIILHPFRTLSLVMVAFVPVSVHICACFCRRTLVMSMSLVSPKLSGLYVTNVRSRVLSSLWWRL